MGHPTLLHDEYTMSDCSFKNVITDVVTSVAFLLSFYLTVSGNTEIKTIS